jgi:hypothetical protein
MDNLIFAAAVVGGVILASALLFCAALGVAGFCIEAGRWARRR